LDTHSHLWPGRGESSRVAVAAVYEERSDSSAYPLRTGGVE